MAPFRTFLVASILAAGLLLPAAGLTRGQGTVRMATTTSTQNSGLLDFLLPKFEQASGIRVAVIAVGTGKALRMGESGDVDVVMVHAPKAELEYVARGAYVERRPIMYNRFVLLGPAADPAGAAQAVDIGAALARIAAIQAPFLSRGDNSGTHIKELSLWRLAGVIPEGRWYQEVGQGMGPTLIITNEQQGYTLSDDATYLAFKSKLALAILSKGDEVLRNPYAVMAVNPDRHPGSNFDGAMKLVDWLTSEAGQRAIGRFSIGGRALFVPSARERQ
ncbi:MAG: substrate-binding domain-containing protein [SAR324 cluster bacterium]|nr:substrate-binding domain-containing protein [SAR324 cluster bacterium]